MERRKWTVALGIYAAMLLCGCSLAVPGAETEDGTDRLIGVFITDEYLDLFDMDSFLQDHASRLIKANEIQIGKASGYEQKLYAVIDKKNSENISDWDISFGDVEGISFFAPCLQEESGEMVRLPVYSAGISDSNTNINVTDDGEKVSLQGTIYMVPGQMDKNIAYYMNPVYQTEDGRIYLTGGSGFSTSGESGEGVHSTTTLSGEIKLTENERATTEKSSVAVSYATMHRPVKITLYQMDGNHQCIKEQEYIPGTLPESMEMEPEAAYLLTETEKERLSGERFLIREVYDRREDDDNILKTWYDLGNGILAGQETTLEWK